MEPSFLHEDSPSPTTTPESPKIGRRKQLNYEDLCVGAILWLPEQNRIDPLFSVPAVPVHESDCSRRGYNHPLVVLKIRQRKDSEVIGDVICTVALLTTFKNTSLEDYLELRPRRRYLQQSLPISQAQKSGLDKVLEHENSVPLLQLESRTLHKQGYVRLDHVWDIPIDMLRSYGLKKKNSRAYHFRLNKMSYEEVMRRVELPNEHFEDRARLFETFKTRFSDLAKSQTRGRTQSPPDSSDFASWQRNWQVTEPAAVVDYGSITWPERRVPDRNLLPYYSECAPDEHDKSTFGLSKMKAFGTGILLGVIAFVRWKFWRNN